MTTWLAVGSALVVAFVLLGLLALVRLEVPADSLRARYASPASRFLEIEGMDVHYRDQGDGPALVLLHGGTNSLETWEGWVRELSSDARIVSLDYQGHGLTGPHPRGEYSPEAIARVVDELVKKLGLDRFIVGGNSYGGAAAWRYATLHPENVRGLILVGSIGLPMDEPPPSLFRLYRVPVLGALIPWLTPRFAVRASLEDAYGDPSRVSEELVSRYHDLTLRAGNRRAWRQAFGFSEPRPDALELLRSIRAPALVLWGGNDTWALPKYAERFAAALPDASVRIYDGLGHLPQEEDAARTANDVRSFVQSHSWGASARR